jgi:hypothetical protein
MVGVPPSQLPELLDLLDRIAALRMVDGDFWTPSRNWHSALLPRAQSFGAVANTPRPLAGVFSSREHLPNLHGSSPCAGGMAPNRTR